jgi:archaeal flagellar protein FlaJ
MIEAIKKNIDAEIELLREIHMFKRLSYSKGSENKLITEVVKTLENKLRIINANLPDLVKNVAPVKKISDTKTLEFASVPMNNESGTDYVVLNKKDKESFLKQASINIALLEQLKNKKGKNQELEVGFVGSRGYIKMANRFFLDKSQELIKKGYFKGLKLDLSKANLDILFSSYVSMILLSTAIAVGVGILFTLMLLFFKIGITFPFFEPYDGSLLSRTLKVFWVLLAIPVGTLLALYYYPSSERDSIAKRIDQEIPFAVIHMSAISGSGIEPSEIFKIIGRSEEYPALRKEIRKIINQINLYGYDLVTALNNVARTTPSTKLSELFTGLATTINSGGDLSDFFEKRAETLLVGYRLEREKFTKVAETFMDIYISVVIAAPMILMLLLVMIQVSHISVGFTTTQLTMLIILGIAIMNVFFLTFLHMKQPTY